MDVRAQSARPGPPRHSSSLPHAASSRAGGPTYAQEVLQVLSLLFVAGYYAGVFLAMGFAVIAGKALHNRFWGDR